MSRSKATKRRRVWVNHSNDGSDGFHEECAYWSKQEALDQYSSCNVETAVPFLECLPGDVVLSREDVAELRELVQANLSATRPSGTDGRILALLRGRR
jgi:hypothetical protein